MYLEKKINGIEVSLDTDIDRAGEASPHRVSGCWLNVADCSGSLEFALHLGGLENSEGELIEIHPQTLAKIESWALANGY